MWKFRTLFLFLVTFFIVSSVAAAPIRYYANLTGGQELPAVTTSAYGRAGFEFNESASSMSYIIRTNIAAPTAAHIHCAPAGQNGPVGVTLQLRAATGHGTITKPDTNNACGWTSVADVMSAIQNGNAYINVHTSAFPTGEIRGQIR